MLLQQQIKEDMKTAMKAKEGEKVTTLRGVMSAMTNKLVELGKMPQDELADTDALAVIKTEVKRRKDALQQFSDAGRSDLADAEKIELDILQVYLPATMDKAKIHELAVAKKESMGITDKAKIGQLIGALMGELKDTADGTDVKEVVEALFI